MRIICKFDDRIYKIHDEEQRKKQIESRIQECNDVIKDKFAKLIIFGLFGVLPFIFCVYILYVDYDSFWTDKTFWEYAHEDILICTIVVALFWLFIWYIFKAYNNSLISKYKRCLKEIEINETEAIKNEIDDDVFENSIKLSYKYLDEYYEQTKTQAKNGFYVTIGVAIFGAVILCVGIVLMFWGKTEPAYVTCGSGVLVEFISSIFFYLYNKTIISMRNYHDKLVLSQNVSIALKVADSIDNEEKNSSKVKIIDELLKNINSYIVVNNAIDE